MNDLAFVEIAMAPKQFLSTVKSESKYGLDDQLSLLGEQAKPEHKNLICTNMPRYPGYLSF